MLLPREVHFDGKNNPDLSVDYGKKHCDRLGIVFMKMRGDTGCERDFLRSSIRIGSNDFRLIIWGNSRSYAG
jgi:hypothetical protein